MDKTPKESGNSPNAMFAKEKLQELDMNLNAMKVKLDSLESRYSSQDEKMDTMAKLPSQVEGFRSDVEVSDLDHPRGVKKSKKIPPKSGSPAWFLVLFGHPILAGGYDQDTTHLRS